MKNIVPKLIKISIRHDILINLYFLLFSFHSETSYVFRNHKNCISEWNAFYLEKVSISEISFQSILLQSQEYRSVEV